MQPYDMLSRGNVYAENSIATKFCHLALGGPVIMPHRVEIKPCCDVTFCTVS